MQEMEWRDGNFVPVDPRPFAIRIILAHLEGLTPEEFAKREMELRGWDEDDDAPPTPSPPRAG